MGYRAYAVGLIGVRLKPEVIASKLYTEKKVPGCKHVTRHITEFCPTCGKVAYETVQEPIEEYDENVDDGEPKLCGYRLLSRSSEDYDDPVFIAHWCSRLLDVDEVAFKEMESVDMVYIKDTMRKRLKPLGLFDDKAFGLHIFTYESC